MVRHLRVLAGFALSLVLVATSVLQASDHGSPPGHRPPPPEITHGVASGDVSAHSAIVWSRASGRALMLVEYSTEPGFRHRRFGGIDFAHAETDYTARVKVRRLEPDTQYFYRVRFVGLGGRSEPAEGSFRTAPAPWMSRPVSFVIGGDLGLGFCRRFDIGYLAFDWMLGLAPDFFIANGDMIYADFRCPEIGPLFPGGPGGTPINWINVPGDFVGVAEPSVDWTDLDQLRDIYWRHWRYNRADGHFQRFLQRVPMYAQWDDHEVINDSGFSWEYWNVDTIRRPGFPNLVTAGRDAFFHYSPVDRNRREPTRIYRSFSWGRHLELFIVDARSYRSRNDLPDSPEKTMLGAAQLEWLKQGLLDSTATWKVVSIDVPLSFPSGFNAGRYGRDSFANGTGGALAPQTGFERELLDLLTFLDDHEIKNIVFVVTDLHLAANIRYEVDLNGDGTPLVFHELLSGPLSASPSGAPTQAFLDPTLSPELLYPTNGAYPDGIRFNFGYGRIQEDPTDGLAHFLWEVRRVADGLARPGSELNLRPQ